MKATIRVEEYHEDRASEEKEIVVTDSGHDNVIIDVGGASYICDRAELLRLLSAIVPSYVNRQGGLVYMGYRYGYA